MFRMYVPADEQTKNYGLLVYLHGDTVVDFDGLWPAVKRLATKHHMIALTARAPSRNSWWQESEVNARILNALLLERIMKKYNINQNRVVYTGQSGGPTFLTGDWMYKFAPQYGGGAILLCGSRLITKTDFGGDDAWKKAFKLRIETTSGDFLHSGALSAAQNFETLGMDVKLTTWGSGSHCMFPQVAEQIIDQRLSEVVPH